MNMRQNPIEDKDFSLQMRSLLFLLNSTVSPPSPDDIQYYLKDAKNLATVLFLIKRHGLGATIYKRLKEDPVLSLDKNLTTALAPELRLQKIRTLKYIAHLHALCDLFTQHDIRHLTLKGPALSQLIFKDALHRKSSDIDLLISPQDFDQCEALLLDQGYRRCHPSGPLSPFKMKMFQKRDNAAGYVKDGVLVELHWRLFSNPELLDLDFEDLFEKRMSLCVQKKSVLCMGESDLLLYLCAHGAKHQWILLKWLEDIAKLLEITTPEHLEDTMDKARKNGLEAVLLSSLQLVELFYSIKVDLRQTSSTAVQKHADLLSLHALKSLKETNTPSYFQASHRADIFVYLRQFLLKKSVPYRFRLLGRFALNTQDWVNVPLPDVLFPLYYLLRPFLWLFRK
ncbi:nucleotidyltransferase family protein [Terasakiella pusilla]|uniref:nucleotidyltransferase domain-containing protein n=1 Tax=Terasakiella pusilla TaxID=64973 RepID=UPI003AA82801